MTNAKTDRDGLFRKFNIFQILMGARIYKFNIFYEIKDILLKYDDQYDYINFGYWSQGDATANPSAELVSRIASNLELTLEDIVLNAGSGLGQPDIDIVREFHPRKIIGINIIEEQVEYANEKAASEGLSGVIEHRTLDAGDISEELKNEHITCVISVEGICEFPNAGKFFQDCHSLLPEGGRVSFSDFVSVKSSRGLLERWIGRIFKSITTYMETIGGLSRRIGTFSKMRVLRTSLWKVVGRRCFHT